MIYEYYIFNVQGFDKGRYVFLHLSDRASTYTKHYLNLKIWLYSNRIRNGYKPSP